LDLQQLSTSRRDTNRPRSVEPGRGSPQR
jgi:hypothetical protein